MDSSKSIVALFDFDGVVMDTESQYTIYWDEVGRKYYPQQENFGHIIKGMTLVQIYDKYFSGMTEEQNEITEGLDEFEKNMTFQYIDGVVDFMCELRQHGVKMAIVTSSNNKKMDRVYAAHPELKDMVDEILTSERFTRSKPNPDCFLLGAEVFQSVAENCVVFEDSFHGLQAGQSADMLVVGLSTTNSAQSIAGKCDKVIPDFTSFGYADFMSLLGMEKAK